MAKRFGVDLKISRLMLLIGLMCERLRRFPEGEQILRAMQAYRDDLPHPGTFLALCHLSQGRLREALQELEVARAAYPDFQMSKVLLAIAQRDAGKAGWQQLLQEVIDEGRDEYAVKLAQDTLGFDTDGLSTSPAPPTSAESSISAKSDTPGSIPHAQRVYV